MTETAAATTTPTAVPPPPKRSFGDVLFDVILWGGIAVLLIISFVPGGPFYANEPQLNTLRLSFVTVPPEKIRRGVAILGKILRDAIAGGLRASA